MRGRLCKGYLEMMRLNIAKAAVPSFSCTYIQRIMGLDSSNNIDSRKSITTFFNFPDIFQRYIRHLQCNIL